MPGFREAEVETWYQHERQLALAKQDVHAGVLSALMGLAWFITVVWNGGRVRLLLSNLALQRPLFFCAACLLPPLLVRRWGLLWWARRRSRVLLALRLLHLSLLTAMGSHLDTLFSPAESGGWRTAGRLWIAARGFPLLLDPLGFQLAPGITAMLQAAAAAAAALHVRSACAATGSLMQLPRSHDNLARICRWLGHAPTIAPMPMPTVDLPPHSDPCLVLALWVQVCWLLLFPCLLVTLWDVQARRRFALRLQPGALPPAERACWAGLLLPATWQVVVLFMPSLSMVLYRLAVLTLEYKPPEETPEG